jgi:hypothetical protein
MLALVLMDHYLRDRGQNADVHVDQGAKVAFKPLLPGGD